MQVSYNLRYQKFNFANRSILDKEGEAIIYEKGFRLKGKGANDKGELINFSEIKEFYYREEKLFFITFAKEKYVLSEAGSLFEQFLMDIYRSRNEFLMDALFMKGGKMKAEFEANFERISKFGRPINKGRGKVRLYEYSMVVIPETQDAFALHYNFIKLHDFDELDYSLKIVMDDGLTVNFAQFGNDYEMFEERLNEILGGMYETFVNEDLKEAFPEFHSGTLLKLAAYMKGGKAVSMKEINKIEPELFEAVEKFVIEDENFQKKIDFLKEQTDENGIMYGIARDRKVSESFVRWVMVLIPDKNLVAFSILPRWKSGEDDGKKVHNETYFYKIIMEKGMPHDKMEDKINEINQALVNLNFVKDPCYKDKRELKHSPYKYAIRKLPYLRILRKSYIGRAVIEDFKDWTMQVKKILEKAEL